MSALKIANRSNLFGVPTSELAEVIERQETLAKWTSIFEKLYYRVRKIV
ncbi:MAG: hypothetical protein ACR2NK_08840 [Mariniblastus sp.]